MCLLTVPEVKNEDTNRWGILSTELAVRLDTLLLVEFVILRYPTCATEAQMNVSIKIMIGGV
jgi:hypothetical protein